MKILKTSILLIVIFLFEVLYYAIIHKSYNTELTSHLREKVIENEVKTKSAINTFNLVSETVFSQIINQEKILKLYSRANNADSIEAQIIRDSLYGIIKETYQHLTKINIKQLHFHLTDNRSFLRFHRPEIYGDDLTDYRFSVKTANLKQIPIKGFEEGRIYNGFRFVFPLHYNNQHIGTVETSFSFEAIRNQLQQLGIHHSGFMLKKEMVANTVFESEQENYITSVLSGEYVNEKAFLHYSVDSNAFLKNIDSQISEKIKDLLIDNQSFAIDTKYKNSYYIITFISIKNVENIPVAYIVTYEEEKNLSFSSQQYFFVLILGLLIIPVLILFIYLYIQTSEKTKKQNKVLLKSEEALKNTNLDLARLNATKDKFFSIIGHDLKNPFNSIIGLSEIIVEKSSDSQNEQIHVFAKNIYEQSLRTFELLENLLDWSRVQTGMISPRFDSVSINNLINRVILLTKGMADQKQIHIESSLPEEFEIWADKYMVETILRNIVTNAIKYSFPDGFIQISTLKIDDYICINISDRGIGMEVNCAKNLFNESYLQSVNGTMGEKGTGLGLLLCKEFILLNSGKIEVSQNTGSGTIFSIYLKKYQPQPNKTD